MKLNINTVTVIRVTQMPPSGTPSGGPPLQHAPTESTWWEKLETSAPQKTRAPQKTATQKTSNAHRVYSSTMGFSIEVAFCGVWVSSFSVPLQWKIPKYTGMYLAGHNLWCTVFCGARVLRFFHQVLSLYSCMHSCHLRVVQGRAARQGHLRVYNYCNFVNI